jgi:hypothetical protein
MRKEGVKVTKTSMIIDLFNGEVLSKQEIGFSAIFSILSKAHLITLNIFPAAFSRELGKITTVKRDFNHKGHEGHRE